MDFLPTGNEYIALPTIQSADGAIESLNFLHMGFRGLVEVGGAGTGTGDDEGAGTPLLRPFLAIAGEPVSLGDLKWERLGGWIPQFVAAVGGVQLTGTYLAPAGQRGFVTRLNVRCGSAARRVSWGWDGAWGYTRHTINVSKPLNGSRHYYYSQWNEGSALDFRSVVSVFALTPSAEGADYLPTVAPGDDRVYPSQGDLVRFGLRKQAALLPDQEAELTVYWGLGLEEVGAVTAGREMQRTGFSRLLRETLTWLRARQRTTGDAELDRVMNLNLLFNQLFASGRCLDTEELVSVTSRSPRYYVSAAYWDRDSLYWSFPALLISDPGHAREILQYAFRRQGRNFGVHSRYIDGVVLEPGFELDELVGPLLAVESYVQATGDGSLLGDVSVQVGLQRILTGLAAKKHPSVDLYETFLLPTDDPAEYPYCTYDNVLVWKALGAATRLGLGSEYAEQAERVRAAIWQYCVVDGPDGRLFAWEVDLRGRHRLYDEPPGSLQLLPFHGFCTWDDPVYQATVRFVRSQAYRHAFAGCAFEELGCAHAEHPWILSAANSLLMPFRREQARDLIIRAPMDGGIACESIDEHTGQCTTGAAFATCAGYLAYAIHTAFAKPGGERRDGTW